MGKLTKRILQSYKTRYSGYEDHNPFMFYGSVLSDDVPISWIDRLQFKVPVSLVPVDESFFTDSVSKKYQKGLSEKYQIPGTVIKIGWAGKDKFLYVDVLYFYFNRPVFSALVDLLLSLMDRHIIKLSANRKRAIETAKLFKLNEAEIRFDMAGGKNDLGGKIINLLGIYRDDQGRLKISSWVSRREAGYYLKVYERKNFVRVEIVLYSKALKDVATTFIDLSKPVTFINRLLPTIFIFIERIARLKKELRPVLEILRNCKIFQKRIKEISVPLGLGNINIFQAQLNNVF